MMTEDEWQQSTEPVLMLVVMWSQRPADARKARLYCCAWARRVWPLLSEEGRHAVEVAERFADEDASKEELLRARAALASAEATSLQAAIGADSRAVAATSIAPDRAAYAVTAGTASELAEQASLIRCIFGYPFGTVRTIDPWYRTESVVALAQRIYDEGCFHRLPEVAKALDSAGYTDTALLGHLRSPGPHARGCFVLDLILGKM